MNVEYKNVLDDKHAFKEMLRYSKGQRQVPVIVEESGKVTIGYGGS